MECHNCTQLQAVFVCGLCDDALYCNQTCANAHYQYHQITCIGDVALPAWSKEYRLRGYYKSSMAIIRRIRKTDIFSFLCLFIYGSTKWINATLFAANGDWTKLSTQQYMDISAKNNANGAVFETVYRFGLQQAATKVHNPLKDKTRKHAIVTKEQLVHYYPEMKRYLVMKPQAFLHAFCTTLQRLLMSVPPLKSPLETYRGYAPINVPNSLALDIARYKVGQVITNWGFMSVTIDKRIAAAFTGPACCYMKLTIPAGMSAFMITSDSTDREFPSIHTEYAQQEILLPAGVMVKLGKHLGKRAYINYQTKKRILVDTIEAAVVGFAKIKGGQ